MVAWLVLVYKINMQPYLWNYIITNDQIFLAWGWKNHKKYQYHVRKLSEEGHLEAYF
jgi:hypothetical protein